MNCEICGQETPCCRCDYAVVEAAAQLEANAERWREETRRMQAEEMKKLYRHSTQQEKAHG